MDSFHGANCLGSNNQPYQPYQRRPVEGLLVGGFRWGSSLTSKNKVFKEAYRGNYSIWAMSFSKKKTFTTIPRLPGVFPETEVVNGWFAWMVCFWGSEIPPKTRCPFGSLGVHVFKFMWHIFFMGTGWWFLAAALVGVSYICVCIDANHISTHPSMVYLPSFTIKIHHSCR